jgi:uncharacterized protein YuzE
MKHLQRVTRETAGGHSLVYLYYDAAKAVARTIDVTDSGSVAIDLGADGETVGIELLDPGADELEALARITRDRNLSLGGLFSATA